MRIGNCQRKTQKNGFILANPANKPTVHYEIWLFGGGSFDLPHLHRRIPMKLGAKVTYKDAFVASSTARRILPTPDLSHHFRI